MGDDASKRVTPIQSPGDDETKVLPRPPASTPAGGPVQPRAKKPWWLSLIWALIRLGAVATALLLVAQLSAGYLATPLAQWIVAVVAVLALPSGLYLFLRSRVKKRSPGARFKLSWLTWSFGWGLVIATLIWVNLPGIGTMAVGVQGANLARGLAAATAEEHAAPAAVIWMARLATRITGAVEAGILGEEPTRQRREAGSAALDAFGAKTTQPGTAPPATTPVAVAGGVSHELEGERLGPAVTTGAGSEPAPALSEPRAAAGQAQTAPSGTSAAESAGSGATVGTLPVPLPGRAALEQSGPATTAKPTVVEVPFEQEGGYLLVDVVINRRYPARLRIDSTVTYTTLDGTTLRRMGITPKAGAPTITLETPAGRQTDVVVILDTIAVGGLEVESPTIMRCNDCRTLTYQGILGYNVLSNFQMSVDNTHGVLLFTDRRDVADRRDDIRPFVELEADPKPAEGQSQPFVVTATNRADRTIGTLFARLTLMDDSRTPVGHQDVRLPPIPPGSSVSTRVNVPRSPPFSYFAVALGTARW